MSKIKQEMEGYRSIQRDDLADDEYYARLEKEKQEYIQLLWDRHNELKESVERTYDRLARNRREQVKGGGQSVSEN